MNEVKSIGIVGFGDFGEFIFMLSQKYFPGIKIKIYSRSNEIDNNKFFDLEETTRSDLVFLTVPIKNFATVLKEVSKIFGESSVLVDISTVKEFPLNEIKKYPNLKYISTHPMFGPFSYEKIGGKLDGLRIVLTSHNLIEKEYISLKDTLKNKLKLNLVEMTAEEHDKLLSETLFLTHLIAQTVIEAKYQRTDIDTVSFGFLMNAVESVQGDKDLFKDVYKYNRFAKKVVKNLGEASKKILKELEL